MILGGVKNSSLGEMWLPFGKLVNIVNIICGVRGIIIKNRAKKGFCEQAKKIEGKTEVNRSFGTHYG